MRRAARPVPSRTQLALKLQKGAQRQSSDTIYQDVARSHLDRVSLRRRADEEEQADCEEHWPCLTCLSFIIMLLSQFQLISRKILVFVPRVAGIPTSCNFKQRDPCTRFFAALLSLQEPYQRCYFPAQAWRCRSSLRYIIIPALLSYSIFFISAKVQTALWKNFLFLFFKSSALLLLHWTSYRHKTEKLMEEKAFVKPQETFKAALRFVSAENFEYRKLNKIWDIR